MADVKHRKSWTTLATELNMDVRTLKKNCFGIMRRLVKIAGKKNFRVLNAKQIKLIKTHLDY